MAGFVFNSFFTLGHRRASCGSMESLLYFTAKTHSASYSAHGGRFLGESVTSAFLPTKFDVIFRINFQL